MSIVVERVEWVFLWSGWKVLVLAFRRYITTPVQIGAFTTQKGVWGPIEWVEDQLNGLGSVQFYSVLQFYIVKHKGFHNAPNHV